MFCLCVGSVSVIGFGVFRVVVVRLLVFCFFLFGFELEIEGFSSFIFFRFVG